MSRDTACNGQSQGDVDTGVRRLRVLHVVIQAGPTNSQWHEHCLPVADEREITVCSLYPGTVAPDPRIRRIEGDGSLRGALSALRTALRRTDYDVVHVHAPASAAILMTACALERRSCANVVLTLHTSWPDLRPRNRFLDAIAFATFPAVVACSRSCADSFPWAVRRLARSGVDVVHNGVDLDRLLRLLKDSVDQGDRAPLDPRDGQGLRVITVGRLIDSKRHRTLLSAFARIAGSRDRLVFVGDGPLRAALERQAAELGIADHVEFLGLVSRDEVYRLLARADLFVSPSQFEGLPVAVLEAMAAQLPVVLSDIPPHREIVEGKGIAALVPLDDVDGFAAAMGRLRNMDAEERRLIGAESLRIVTEGFSLRSMTDGYQDIYSRFLVGNGSLTRRAHD
ncbi:MAG TPA: glycosyltransferase [Nocardioidaceae bacterium]|nr:glycosyltransferase [Nocardioidaceae bacterium]